MKTHLPAWRHPAVLLLTVAMSLALMPAPAISADFEIPLNDLKTVKKKAPKKSEKRHKQHKKEIPAEEGKAPANAEQAASPAPAAPPATAASAPAPPPAAAAPAQELQTAAAAAQGGAIISHTPYSFIVAGKRTRLSAVVSSGDQIQSVRCMYRSNPTAAFEQVAMAKAEGTQFTYGLTIPPLAGEAQQLQYRFIVTEQSGRVTRSPEFLIPLRSTGFVPGWQE